MCLPFLYTLLFANLSYTLNMKFNMTGISFAVLILPKQIQ